MTHQTLVVRRRGGNRGCGIYRSSSGMSVNQDGSLSPNRRPRFVENEYGVKKVESVGRKIPGNGYVVGEISHMETPFPFHPKKHCRDSSK
jgi:hypothetical protein